MSGGTLTKTNQGFFFLLNPTPVQSHLLSNHTEATRFGHNFLLVFVDHEVLNEQGYSQRSL